MTLENIERGIMKRIITFFLIVSFIFSAQVLQTDGNGTLSWVNNAGGGGGGNPGGSNYQVQYNNSSSFGGASNVEIRSNTLALKEQSSPSAVSGYGQIYPKTDNNLYYLKKH